MKLIELVRRIFHEEVTAYTNVVQLSRKNYEVIVDQDEQLTDTEKVEFKKAAFFRHPKATNLILSVHPRLNDMQIQVIRDKIINLSDEIVNAADFYSLVGAPAPTSTSATPPQTNKPAVKPTPPPSEEKKPN